MRAVQAPTIMTDDASRAALARLVIDAAGRARHRSGG